MKWGEQEGIMGNNRGERENDIKRKRRSYGRESLENKGKLWKGKWKNRLNDGECVKSEKNSEKNEGEVKENEKRRSS